MFNNALKFDFSKRHSITSLLVCLFTVLFFTGCGLTTLTVGTYKAATDPRTVDELATDKRIEAEMQKILLFDETIKDYDLQVVCIQGHVYLAGQLHTERERVRTANLARRIDGVTDVTTAVKVRYRYREGPDDLSICSRIQFEFIKDLHLRWLNVGVHCNEGDVTLNGIVKTDDERRRAEKHAENTEGVTFVTNHIVVKE